jgi:hypothetical protein
VTKTIPIGTISSLIDEPEKHLIDIELWFMYSEYADIPKVAFSIAHSGDYIFIKYDAVEHEVLARYKQINDPVYKIAGRSFLSFLIKLSHTITLNLTGWGLVLVVMVAKERTERHCL